MVIVHEDLLKSNPEKIKAFFKSAQKGWGIYLKKPERVNALMQKLNPSMSLEVFNQVAHVQVPFIETASTKKEGLGSMKSERWKQLYDQLVEIKLVPASLHYSEFYALIK